MLTYEEVEALKKGDRLAVRNMSTEYKWEPGTVTSVGTLLSSPSIWVQFDKDHKQHSINIATGMQFKKVHWEQSNSAELFKHTTITKDFIEYAEIEADEVKEFAASLVGLDIREADKKLGALMNDLLQTDLPRRNLYVKLARYLSSHGNWGFTVGDDVNLIISSGRTKATVVKDIEEDGLVHTDNKYVSPSLIVPIAPPEADNTKVYEQLNLFD